MADAKPFIFICGPDDFLVGRLGRERYDELAREIDDEFSRETISGFANNVGEVETAINQFREALQTISMFGGRRLVATDDRLVIDQLEQATEEARALLTDA